MIPADRAPIVSEDPGLLQAMQPEEMQSCAYRICYSGKRIIIEAFHAMTDGYGAITTLRTLVAEYLHLRHDIRSEERQEMLEKEEPDWDQELRRYHQHYRYPLWREAGTGEPVLPESAKRAGVKSKTPLRKVSFFIG